MRAGSPRLDLIAWEEYILVNEHAATSYHRYKDSVDQRYFDLDLAAENRERIERARQQGTCDPA